MKFFFKTFAGNVDTFELDLAPSLVDQIKAEILEEVGTPPEHCLYFEEASLWDGSKLSEHIFELARAKALLPAPPSGGDGAGASRPREGVPGAAARVAAEEAKGREGGYTSLEEGLTGLGGASTSCASDGGAKSDARGVAKRAAAKATSAQGKGKGSARKGNSSVEFQEDSGKVVIRINEKEAKLVSKDVEFRWIPGASKSKHGWIVVTNFKKDAPVPRMVREADPEPTICLLFPGEGCQYPGMCGQVRSLPSAQDLFKRASSVLKYDTMELMTYGPAFMLGQTRYCQPIIFVASFAALEKLKALRPETAARASVIAGYGVGQFTALCAAGVLGFEDMLRLVQIRAEAMEETCLAARQLMVLVVGLDRKKVLEMCAEAEWEAGPGAMCRIAGEVLPSGYTVAGTEKAVLLTKAMAESAGAFMVRVMNQQVASETPVMAPAGERFFAALDAALPAMRPPSCAVWSTVGPRVFLVGCSPAEIVEDLKAHLTSPCLWESLTLELNRQDIGEFYELAPKSFIRSMNTRICPRMKSRLHNIEV